MKKLKYDVELNDIMNENEEDHIECNLELTKDKLYKELKDKEIELYKKYPQIKEIKFTYDIWITPYTEESDEEYNKRLKKEEQNKLKKEEKERKLLEKLKNKYEK